MIVVDSSVVVDLILNIEPYFDKISERILNESPNLFAPYLLDAEVTQILRKFTLNGKITTSRANTAIEDYKDLPITRYPHLPLLNRAFELRNNLTVYDALYLTLAEALEVSLLTRDNSFAKVSKVKSEVQIIS